MHPLIHRFLRDESGSVFVGDWVFVATILVLGSVAGAAALQQPPAEEVDDTPAAAAPAQPSGPVATPAVAAERP